MFAVQLVNFPVGAGTSGHLLGGALAAALVGPWTAVLVMSTVLLVQGLLFADGGLTALGTNTTLMGLITVLVGYALTRTLLQVLPRRMESLVPAATVGALFSVPTQLGTCSRTWCWSMPMATPRRSRPTGRSRRSRPGGRSASGFAVTLVVAGGLSLFASAHPDGLEFVGAKLGFDSAAKDSAVAGSPLAD